MLKMEYFAKMRKLCEDRDVCLFFFATGLLLLFLAFSTGNDIPIWIPIIIGIVGYQCTTAAILMGCSIGASMIKLDKKLDNKSISQRKEQAQLSSNYLGFILCTLYILGLLFITTAGVMSIEDTTFDTFLFKVFYYVIFISSIVHLNNGFCKVTTRYCQRSDALSMGTN